MTRDARTLPIYFGTCGTSVLVTHARVPVEPRAPASGPSMPPNLMCRGSAVDVKVVRRHFVHPGLLSGPRVTNRDSTLLKFHLSKH